ncbi:MAG: hypothetical protein V4620_13535 [Bacteroidota bacterium]
MNKPPKITYLLGAGASYNALPIVNELVNVAQGMLSYLHQTKTLNPYKQFEFTKTHALIDEVAKHHSIDTLARKIWLKNRG